MVKGRIMKLTKRRLALGAAALVASGSVAIAVADSGSFQFSSVPTANSRAQGYAPASMLSAGLAQIAVAQGSTRVENPSTAISYYGYDNDTLDAAGQPVMVASTASGNQEAHKTEPDKNTYLVFKRGLPGADGHYDYGTHFLFQGHETGSPGYITRINLDADAAHRVTVLATKRCDRCADRRHRRLDLGSIRTAPAVDDGEPERADVLGNARLPVSGDRHLRRARPGWL